MAKAHVVTAGETMACLVPEAGVSLRHAVGLNLHVGGAESNVAIGVRRLGVASTWIGRVGDDGLGRRVAAELRAEDLDVRLTVDPERPTAIMLKEASPLGHTRVTYHRAGSAGSRLSPDDLPHDVIEAIDEDTIVHVTGITAGLSASAAAMIDRLLDLAQDRGATVSFDVNHRPRIWAGRDPSTRYRALAARADVVFAGLDEACLLVGRGSPAEMASRLAEVGIHQVLIKRGDWGSYALIDGRAYEEPAVPVPVVDTVGAGDAFAAGYLAELAQGCDPAQRMVTAATAGALVCTSLDDWSRAPRREELEAVAHVTDAVVR